MPSHDTILFLFNAISWALVLGIGVYAFILGLVYLLQCPVTDKMVAQAGPHWESVPCLEEDTGILIGHKVRWSEPDERGQYLWVGHYYADQEENLFGRSLGWCSVAAEGHARRLNDQGKLPWEYREYHI